MPHRVNPLRGGKPAEMSAGDGFVFEQAAASVESTLAELRSALERARLNEARSRTFLADAAHHLRNPIAGIRACSEALLRGPDAAARDRLLAEIVRETSHLSRVVDRLLQIARLEQGEPLWFETHDIRALCQDEIERAESLAPQLSIVMTADNTVPLALDPRAVCQCVGIILDNARRHSTSRIDVSVVSGDGEVAVHVRDDGPGLLEGAENQAFEPFVSLDGDGGSGLGLTLARSLARAHGGDLTYEDGAFVLRVSDGAGSYKYGWAGLE
jgi:two-component system OmpR family sensor kinase